MIDDYEARKTNALTEAVNASYCDYTVRGKIKLLKANMELVQSYAQAMPPKSQSRARANDTALNLQWQLDQLQGAA